MTSSKQGVLQIHWAAGSPFAWRVLLAAELKRIPYESKLLEFSKGQLKTKDFLAMNPRGKVPVIRDGDFVLTESLAILSYLDRKYPETPLFGRTAEEAGRIQLAISDFESYLRQPLDLLNGWLFGDKPRTAEIDDAHTTAKAEIDRFENRIGRGPWLVGATPNAADVVWFPSMRLLLRASVRKEARTRELGWFPFANVFPNIGAFIARVEALPGYEKTYPPHWRESV